MDVVPPWLANYEEAVRAFRKADGLWRGPPLADFRSEPFARGRADRLDELRLGATEELIDAELALGHHRLIVAELEALVTDHPLRERLLCQLMLALYRSGRQADALDAYLRARSVLNEQLGLEPGPGSARTPDANSSTRCGTRAAALC